MASLIPGFEYDIFISYRQKDNKGDRWVSEFVEALKTELASTFKEEISIYFDINPHDGLLETHDVDASLAEKLRCLIFIPVLSRTYCDPKSFAWKNEFEAFTQQASKDQLGLKVKLPNGNITGRVLPVRIHDLDLNDIKLCESIVGGVLHDIEFIYKSEGVNRPLRSTEDKLRENLNNTIYRDQVNKTALAIKEIILGLKGEPDMSVEKSYEHRERERAFYEVKKPLKSIKQKLQIGAGILAILIITVLFVWPGLIGRSDLERLIAKDGRIPVAVMPFQNMTNDTLWDVWEDGIQSFLITSLSNTEELKIRQESINKLLKTSGITDYASLTPSVASSISRKLEANVHITGSVKQSGSTIRLNAQLVNSKTGEALKSFQINGTADSIFTMIDSLSLMFRNFLLISVMKKEQPPFYHEYKVLTNSPEAYRYYLNGNKAFDKIFLDEARDWYLQAIATDSNFCSPIIRLAGVYANQGLFAEGKKWCLKAYKRRDQVPLRVKLVINWLYAEFFGTIYETIKYEKQIKELDDKNPDFYYELGVDYWIISEYDKAINEYKQSLEIYKEWGSKPDWVNSYTALGEVYIKTNQLKKLKKLIKKAEHDFPKNPDPPSLQAILNLKLGDTVSANRNIEKYISVFKDYYSISASDTEADLMMVRAFIYKTADIPDKAAVYYREALALEPENRGRMRELAYLLIDKDLNISEGLELIEKILEARPDAFRSLDCKGWGLYKQGKYKEALEILQKSWDLRIQNAVYDHEAFLHLEAAKKAVAAMN